MSALIVPCDEGEAVPRPYFCSSSVAIVYPKILDFIQRIASKSRNDLKRRFHTPYLLLPCRRGLLLTGISTTLKPSIFKSVGMKRCRPRYSFNLPTHSRRKAR